jgi:hypothetical protein
MTPFTRDTKRTRSSERLNNSYIRGIEVPVAEPSTPSIADIWVAPQWSID